jgi:RND family efflux transporter MFP subunit
MSKIKDGVIRGIPLIIGQVKNRKKTVIIVAAVLVALIFLFNVGRRLWFIYGPGANTSGLEQKAAGDSGGINYLRITPRELVDSIDVLGQIIFYEKVNVASKVNGRLDKVYIREGTRVTRGQLIAEIERLSLQLSLNEQLAELDIARKSYDLAKAKHENAFKAIEIKFAQINKARAEANDKKVTFDNMERTLNNKAALFKAGGISESDYEAVKAQHTTYYTRYINAKADLGIQEVGFRDKDIVESGYKLPKSRDAKVKLFQEINTKIEKAELEAARSKIRQVEQSIQSTRTLITETYIRSPLTGVVASKNMEAGEIVKNDSIIFIIMDISKVYLSLNINEKESRQISKGQDVTFTADAFPDEKFSGSVSRITPVLDVKTRTMEIKVQVPNPGQRLLPGMFARAKITLGKKANAIIAPLSSLITKENNSGEVYIVKKGLVFKQKVELGKESGNAVEIVKGLQEGDIIVSAGINMVYPEMKVTNPVVKND